jgi:hypothetical protein
VIILIWALLPSCTSLSNRNYIEKYAPFRGIQRVAVFLQHWPVYQQKPGRNNLGEDFITSKTIFLGSWQPAAQMDPRAVDIQDIDDCLMGEILVNMLESKGYQVSLVEMPFAAESATVRMLMAQYQAINPPVDAFLFCYYAPTLFFSQAQATPKDHTRRSYSLQEVVRTHRPGTDAIIWVGERRPDSPVGSMSHAFIYLSMTIFKAINWQTLMAEADSQVGGKVRPWIPRCPPAPTEEKEDIQATISMVRQMKPDFISVSFFTPIPGNDLYTMNARKKI